MKAKQVLITVTAMVLTGVLAIGGTLAYLSTTTETKKNVFSSSKDLEGKIEEDFDESKASNYTPGDVITKIPTVVNESKSVDAYVAVKITCLDADQNEISIADFQSKYGTFDILSDWTEIDTGIYAYADADGTLKVLKAGETSPAVFENVTVNTGIEKVTSTVTGGKVVYKETAPGVYEIVEESTEVTEDTKYYTVTTDEDGNKVYTETTEDLAAKLPSFQIDVTGYLVQAESIDSDEAKAELKALAAAN